MPLHLGAKLVHPLGTLAIVHHLDGLVEICLGGLVAQDFFQHGHGPVRDGCYTGDVSVSLSLLLSIISLRVLISLRELLVYAQLAGKVSVSVYALLVAGYQLR